MSFNQIENKKAIYYPLRDVAEICTGNRNTQDAVEDGKYIFYVRSPNPLRLNEYDYDDVSVITAGDGVGVGKVFHITNGKYALHQRAYRIHPNNSTFLNPVYLYYYFNSKFYEYITKAKYNSSVASIRLPMLQNFEIPIPPLEEQEKIVSVLCRFDKLTKDITEGLQSEIKYRLKQYEYYRDELLTFNSI